MLGALAIWYDHVGFTPEGFTAGNEILGRFAVTSRQVSSDLGNGLGSPVPVAGAAGRQALWVKKPATCPQPLEAQT